MFKFELDGNFATGEAREEEVRYQGARFQPRLIRKFAVYSVWVIT